MFELLKRYDRRELALILLLVGVVAIAPVSTYLVWPAYSSVKTLTASRDTLVAASPRRHRTERQNTGAA